MAITKINGEKIMLKKLLEGVDGLPAGFPEKVETLWDATLTEAVKAKETELVEAHKLEMETIKEAAIEDAKKLYIESTTEKFSAFLDVIVKEWAEENALAIDSGVKVELAESFLEGLGNMFVEHKVKVPEEDGIDLLESQEKEINKLNKRITERTKKIITVESELEKYKRNDVILAVCEGLADTQIERIKVMTEGISFEDPEAFTRKVKTIKESIGDEKKNDDEGKKTDDGKEKKTSNGDAAVDDGDDKKDTEKKKMDESTYDSILLNALNG